MTVIKYLMPLILVLKLIFGNISNGIPGRLADGAAAILSVNSSALSSVSLKTNIMNQLDGEIRAVTGCGPTSAAMLLSSEKGFDITKDEAVVRAYQNGFYYFAGENFTSGRGVTQENIQSFIRDCGFDSEIDHLWNDTDHTITQKIDLHLNKGNRVIVGHNSYHGFLHYALIYGRFTENGEIKYNVADPWGGTASVWTRNELLEQINNVYGYDLSTFEGQVKGIQWLI